MHLCGCLHQQTLIITVPVFQLFKCIHLPECDGSSVNPVAAFVPSGLVGILTAVSVFCAGPDSIIPAENVRIPFSVHKNHFPADFFISSNPPVYAKLFSIGDVGKVLRKKHQKEMEDGLKDKYISDEAREIFASELFQRTTFMRISIANLTRVKNKGNELIEALNHYQH